VFQDLHVFDVHAHFPIKGDLTQGGGRSLRTRDVGQIENEAVKERMAFREQQLARTRQQWRLAFNFPDPEKEPRSSEEQAARWVAELDTYGLERIGFVTGRDNDELARVVAMSPPAGCSCGGSPAPYTPIAKSAQPVRARSSTMISVSTRPPYNVTSVRSAPATAAASEPI
jgi:hypothetical protein